MDNTYQWYPGHMARALKIMRQDISLVDIVIEIADARAPESTRNPNLYDLTKGKGHILILNKSDMSDPKKNKEWIEHYKEEGVNAIAVDSRKKGDIEKIQNLIDKVMEDKYRNSTKKAVRVPRVMICGIPNVGKSTLINTFAGRKSAKTGNRPGVTTGKQWIKIGNRCELLDTPGVLYVKPLSEVSGQRLAFIGSLNDNNLNVEDLAFYLIKWIHENYKGCLTGKYEVEEKEETIETFDAIAIRSGTIKRGGLIDYDRAARLILDDFRNGRLGRITLELPYEFY